METPFTLLDFRQVNVDCSRQIVSKERDFVTNDWLDPR